MEYSIQVSIYITLMSKWPEIMKVYEIYFLMMNKALLGIIFRDTNININALLSNPV